MIQAWEKKQGVVFPKILRQLYLQQNGGPVADSTLELNALKEIRPLTEDDLRHMDFTSEGGKRGKVFSLGGDGSNGWFLLNYEAGPTKEPCLWEFVNNACDLFRRAKTVEEFLRAEITTDDAPAFAWDETGQLDEVLAHERLDFSKETGFTDITEIVLGRKGKRLYFYSRSLEGKVERQERTYLPEPLDASEARVEEFRPSPTRTYELHLEPKKSDKIDTVEAVRTRKGRWKNRHTPGVPVWVGVESTDKAKLRALREKLFGTQKAAKAQQRDDDQAAYLAKMEALPPDAARAAMMHFGMDMIASTPAPDYSQMDPETAALLRATDAKLKMLLGKMQEEMAKHPLDAETKCVIEQMQKNIHEKGQE
jgi:hypothetical protein